MTATLKSTPVILTTSDATLYTYSGTRWAIVRSIQAANINTSSAQVVEISLRRSATNYSLVDNLSIPVGASASALADILYMQPGDIIRGYITSGTTLNVHVVISYEEYS